MVHVPTTVVYTSMESMLEARDAILTLWSIGSISPEEAEARLRALSVKDAQGQSWRLRPTATGSVLIRISQTGEVSLPLPSDFVPAKRKTRTGSLFLLIGAAVWLVVAFSWLTS